MKDKKCAVCNSIVQIKPVSEDDWLDYCELCNQFEPEIKNGK